MEAAWADLRQTIDESKVTSFLACSRNGRSWDEDPEAVRQIAATIGRIVNDTAEGPKGQRATLPGRAGRLWQTRPVPV